MYCVVIIILFYMMYVSLQNLLSLNIDDLSIESGEINFFPDENQ